MSRREPSPPPRLPGFRHVGLLGSGGFADVFRFEQVALGRHVAVKVLLKDLGNQAAEQFRREANLMALLSNHPSIVTIYQAGVSEDGRPYLVMEICPPPHLGARIRRQALSVGKTLEIGIQIAGAVETAHRLDILHRDIKPANILFTEFGRPALTDFGISSSTGEAGTAAFTVAWAPPEQIDGRPMDRTGDVYALAATVWAMLTGHSPFELSGGPNDAVTVSQRVRASAVPPTGRADVPESLERVLRTAMAKDPTRRYASALELARALQGVQAELHQPMTQFEVREQVTEPSADEHEDSGTRVTGFVSIDPDLPSPTPTGTSNIAAEISRGAAHPTVTASGDPSLRAGQLSPAPYTPQERAGHVLQHGTGVRPSSGPIEFTGPAIPTDAPHRQGSLPAPTAEPAPAASADRRASRGAVLATGGVLAVAAVLGGGWFLTHVGDGASDGLNAPSATAAPADPIGSLVAPATDVTAARRGDTVTVEWRNPDPHEGDSYLYRPDTPGTAQAYEATTSTRVTVPATGSRTCVDVVIRRSTGRASEQVVACTP